MSAESCPRPYHYLQRRVAEAANDLLPPSGHSGHGRTFCRLDLVAMIQSEHLFRTTLDAVQVRGMFEWGRPIC